MNRFLSLWFMIILMIFLSCKKEPSLPYPINESSNAEYQQYLKDYQEPKYKWCFIDSLGQKLGNHSFSDARDFQNNMAAVCQAGLWGFIDSNGVIQIKPQYRMVQSFSDDLALVMDFNQKHRFININNELIIDNLLYEFIGSFQENLCLIQSDGKFGFIDKTGQLAIPPSYRSASNFINNRSIVRGHQAFGVINSKGDTVLPFNYDHIQSIPGGYRLTKGKLNYFSNDRADEILGPFQDVAGKKKGVFVFKQGDDWQIQLNNASNKILPCKAVQNAESDYWACMINQQWTWLTNDGLFISEQFFDEIRSFHDGLAAFKNENLWGYMNSQGNFVISAQYPFAWDYEEDKVRVLTNKGFNYLDTVGKTLFKNYFVDARDFNEGKARVQQYPYH